MSLNIIKQDIYPEVIQSNFKQNHFISVGLKKYFKLFKKKEMTKDEADKSFNAYDIKRLEMYAQNLVDYHLVIDLVPEIARIYFINKLGDDFNLSLVQSVC